MHTSGQPYWCAQDMNVSVCVARKACACCAGSLSHRVTELYFLNECEKVMAGVG